MTEAAKNDPAIDLKEIQAGLKAEQAKRRAAQEAEANSAGGYQRAFSEQAKRSREEAKRSKQEQREEKPKADKPKEDEQSTKFTVGVRPAITIPAKVWTDPKFMTIVERTLLHLNDASAGIYQRGNILVQSIEEWGKGVKGERVKVCRLVGMNEKKLERKMMKHIDWRKREKVKSKQDEADRIVEVSRPAR